MCPCSSGGRPLKSFKFLPLPSLHPPWSWRNPGRRFTVSTNSTCCAPGAWKPLRGHGCLFLAMPQRTQVAHPSSPLRMEHHLRGQEGAKTWSGKSIKRHWGRREGGRGHKNTLSTPNPSARLPELPPGRALGCEVEGGRGLRVTPEPVPSTGLPLHSTRPFLHSFISRLPFHQATWSTLVLWVACQPTGA